MITVKRTIVLIGKSESEYESILKHLADTGSENQGWELLKDPLSNTVTAIKTETLEGL